MARLFNDGNVVVGLDLSSIVSSNREIRNFYASAMPVANRTGAWME